LQPINELRPKFANPICFVSIDDVYEQTLDMFHPATLRLGSRNARLGFSLR
jgi:hypothetical protein